MSAPPNVTLLIADWQEQRLTQGVMSRRVVACFLDAIIAGVLTLGLGLPLLAALPAVPIVYAWFFVASPLSATPGQAMLGLAVRRNADLSRPDPWEAFAYVIGFVATIAVGWFWVCVALFTTRHRAFHDIVSGLVVVRRTAITTTDH